MHADKGLIIASVAAVAVTCAFKSVDDISNFQINVVDKSLSATFLCSGDRTYGDDVDVYTRAKAEIQWPERIGDADLKPLQDSLIVRCFGGNAVLQVDEAMRRYVSDPIMLDDDCRLVPVDSNPIAGDMTRMLETDVDADIFTINSRYAVFDIFYYFDGGGAHPVYSTSYVNFDVARSKVLGLNDLILPGKEADLTAVVLRALLVKYDVQSVEQLREQVGIYVDEIDFTASVPQFYLDDYAIVFHFNPYEIGPWAIGSVDVNVGLYELDGIIRPEIAKLLDAQ